MRIICKLVGKGTPEEPYRVPLPTYVIIEVDYKTKTAIVEVPDDYFTEEILKPDGTIEVRKLRKINIKKLMRLYPRWYETDYQKYKDIIDKIELV